MDRSKDVKEILEILEKIKYQNTKIIVEGKKDEKALNELGIKNIFVIHRIGKSLETSIEFLIENLEKKEVSIILTDIDEKGEKYYSIIKENLIRNGFKIDDSLRDLLKKKGISHIEGLSSFIENQ